MAEVRGQRKFVHAVSGRDLSRLGLKKSFKNATIRMNGDALFLDKRQYKRFLRAKAKWAKNG